MPISAYTVQPATNELRAAYQSSYLIAFGLALNPVVYFDIYFNGVYYKTITSTTPFDTVLGAPLFRVDVKDAAQEYLKTALPRDVALSAAPYYIYSPGSILNCFVRVRGSVITGGVLVPDGIAPVQGTANVGPTAGNGLQSNTFMILNATIQTEDDQRLVEVLKPLVQLPNNNFFQLSFRKTFKAGMQDYGWLPIFINNSSTTVNAKLFVEGPTGTRYYPSNTTSSLAGWSVFYLPIGIKNLRSMTPNGWAIPFADMAWYKVGLVFGVTDIYISNQIYVSKCATGKRIYFQNWLGHYEAYSFHDWEEANQVSSGVWQKPQLQEPVIGSKSLAGIQRYNVRSNEQVTVYAQFPESDALLVKEIQTAPSAFLEFQDTTQSTTIKGDLIPIVIKDVDVVTRKIDERWFYEMAITYSMGNPNIHVRN